MFAELVIDLDVVGDDVGKAMGRDSAVLPSMIKIVQLWRSLGVEVSAIHLVVAGYSLRTSGRPSFEEHHVGTWWETETASVEENGLDVTIVPSAVNDEGPVGNDALVVTTALRRSDELVEDSDSPASLVIVMSNSEAVAPAVTHARGVPVMLADTEAVDAELAHAHLDLSWMGMLANRYSPLELPDVELRDGRPWRGNDPICTSFDSLLGRDDSAATLPAFAASVVLFDPEHFAVHDGETDAIPDPLGVAAVVQMLGLGELVHVETPSEESSPELVEASFVATMYRFAKDNPDTPIIVASSRPGVVVATSDLEAYGLINARRFLRLCLPHRDEVFNEMALTGRQSASRVIVERSLSEPLFAEEDTTIRSASLDEEESDRSASPTLFLFTNPAVTRETSHTWRAATRRRFLVLSEDVLGAKPADQLDDQPLPVSLGGCTDFRIRRPNLQAGSIVEGILDTTRERWIVVSDPIERREVARTLSGSDYDRIEDLAA